MILSDEALRKVKLQLIQHEGFKQFPYTCTAGKLTIGIGRNLQDRGITLDEAQYLLTNDIVNCEIDLIKNFPEYKALDDVRKTVLINMCFNLGIAGLMQFRATLNAIKDGNYELSAQQMLDSKWATQVGNRAHELAYMMEFGKYSISGNQNVD